MSTVAEDDYVPPGDPSALADAASRFGHTAEGLLEHAGNIESASSSLLTSWSGDAASRYHATSAYIASRFHVAAGVLQGTSVALGRYSAELDRLIREGTVATEQVRRCLDDVKLATSRVEQAKQAVSDAESDLLSAQHAATAAATAPPGAHCAAAVRAAVTDVQAAQNKLASAQTAESAAMKALESAQDELAQWRARGGSISESAQTTGAQVYATLGQQQLTPPAAPQPRVSGSAPGRTRKGRGSSRRPVTVARWTPVNPFDRPIRRVKDGGGDRLIAKTGGGELALGAPLMGLVGGVTDPKMGTGPVRYDPGGAEPPTMSGAPTVQPPSRTADPAGPGGKGGGGAGGGDGQGSTTVTINPSAGTIDTVTHMKSGETIQVVTYTKSGDVVETITYPGSGPHAGSGETIIAPGPGPAPAPKPSAPTPAPKPSGGAGHRGSGTGSGTTVIG